MLVKTLYMLVKTFRDRSNYEVLRSCGLKSENRLYTPNLEKDLGFVVHDATVTNLSRTSL